MLFEYFLLPTIIPCFRIDLTALKTYISLTASRNVLVRKHIRTYGNAAGMYGIAGTPKMAEYKVHRMKFN